MNFVKVRSLAPGLDIDKYSDETECEVFINNYVQADSLRLHKDHTSTYGPVICGVSLLSDCELSFQNGPVLVDVAIPARSLYFMTGASRFVYKHGLRAGTLTSERRVSITFRSVNCSKQ